MNRPQPFNGVGKQEQECNDLSGSTVRRTPMMILVLDFRLGTEIAQTESELSSLFTIKMWFEMCSAIFIYMIGGVCRSVCLLRFTLTFLIGVFRAERLSREARQPTNIPTKM